MYFWKLIQSLPLITTLIFSSLRAHAEERWSVVASELILNMGIPYSDQPGPGRLIQRDIEEFRLLVAANPEVSTIAVSGKGGYGPAGVAIANDILELGLDTRAFGDCLSACARIFLAGTNRTLTEGGSLGFHRPYVIGKEEKAYFMAYRRERGWDNEFDYVEFIYDVGLTDMLDEVKFMISRGVAFDFIEKAYSHSSFDMWRPDRDLLKRSGVLIESE